MPPPPPRKPPPMLPPPPRKPPPMPPPPTLPPPRCAMATPAARQQQKVTRRKTLMAFPSTWELTPDAAPLQALSSIRMIYTCYEMVRDCHADRPEGWAYFISNYVPLIRK